MRSRTSGTNRYQMLALVQPPPVRTYLPLAIDVEMGSRTAVCVRKNQDNLLGNSTQLSTPCILPFALGRH